MVEGWKWNRMEYEITFWSAKQILHCNVGGGYRNTVKQQNSTSMVLKILLALFNNL